jgi:hypothetical protein
MVVIEGIGTCERRDVENRKRWLRKGEEEERVEEGGAG